MKQLRQYIEDFATLFSGNKECYGVHVPEKNAKEGDKARGQSFTKTQPLAETLYLKHLHGQESLGIVPIDKEGFISFAAIDVDVYPLDPVKYLTMIKIAKLPLVGCRSKSGGLHLYCFFNPPVRATEVIPLMGKIRALLGLPSDTEIFPKQTALNGSSVGNWINLPYYNAENTKRYAYSTEGKEIPLSTFVQSAMQVRTTEKALKIAIKRAPMAQAPPCLQTIFLSGGAEEGSRNDYMRSCGVYLKSRFKEGFPEHLHTLNNNMLDPIDYVRLDKTVIASLNRKDYNYACNSPLLKEHCVRDVCSQRKYGADGQYVSTFNYGQLSRYKGEDDDEYYTWDVNGKVFMLYGIRDLLSQDRFRALCGSKLNKIPNRLKDPVWISIVNTALANVVEEDDKIGAGMSDKAHWRDKVSEFFSTRKALRQDQLAEGLTYLKGDRLFFKVSILQEHLLNIQTLRGVTKIQHRALLKEYGVYRGSIRVGGKPCNFNYVKLSEQHRKNRLLDISENKEREFKRLKRKEEKHKNDKDFKGVIDFKEEEKF